MVYATMTLLLTFYVLLSYQQSHNNKTTINRQINLRSKSSVDLLLQLPIIPLTSSHKPLPSLIPHSTSTSSHLSTLFKPSTVQSPSQPVSQQLTTVFHTTDLSSVTLTKEPSQYSSQLLSTFSPSVSPGSENSSTAPSICPLASTLPSTYSGSVTPAMAPLEPMYQQLPTLMPTAVVAPSQYPLASILPSSFSDSVTPAMSPQPTFQQLPTIVPDISSVSVVPSMTPSQPTSEQLLPIISPLFSSSISPLLAPSQYPSQQLTITFPTVSPSLVVTPSQCPLQIILPSTPSGSVTPPTFPTQPTSQHLPSIMAPNQPPSQQLTTAIPSVFPGLATPLITFAESSTQQPSISHGFVTPTLAPSLYPLQRPPTQRPNIMPASSPVFSISIKSPSQPPSQQPQTTLSPISFGFVTPSISPSQYHPQSPFKLQSTVPPRLVIPIMKSTRPPTFILPSMFPTLSPFNIVSIKVPSQPPFKQLPTILPYIGTFSPILKSSQPSFYQLQSILPTFIPTQAPSQFPFRPFKKSRIPSRVYVPPSSINRTPTRKPISQTASPSNLPRRSSSRLPVHRPTVTPTDKVYPIAPLNYRIPLFSRKRGIVGNFAAGNLTEVNATWFYTYGPANAKPFLKNYKNVEYTSMMFCKDSPIPFPSSSYVLGFNEPDVKVPMFPCKKVALSPVDALHYWSRVENSGSSYIGSPAILKPNAFTWMQAFLAGNSTYKPKVDFLAIHLYDWDPFNFLKIVDTFWKIFRLPIWITEFSKEDGDYRVYNTPCIRSAEYRQKLKDFLRIVIHGLELRHFVHRYAWYSDTNRLHQQCYSLWDVNKVITDVGKAYAGIKELTV